MSVQATHMLNDRTLSTAPEVPERRQCLLSGGFWLVSGVFNFMDSVCTRKLVCVHILRRVSARAMNVLKLAPFPLKGLGNRRFELRCLSSQQREDISSQKERRKYDLYLGRTGAHMFSSK